MTHAPRSLILAACLGAAGCASTTEPQINVGRQTADGLLAGERVAILVSRHSRDGAEASDLGPIEEAIELCLRTEIQAAKPDLAFVAPTQVRQWAADRGGSEAFRSADSLLRLAGESATAARIAEARLRYVLLIEGAYEVGPAQSGVEGISARDGIGWMASTNRLHLSNLQAQVVDVKHRRVSGSIGASLGGTERGGLGVMIGPAFAYPLPIPIPVPFPFPLYENPMTESRACAGMGVALTRFLSVSLPGYDPRWEAELSCSAPQHGPGWYRVEFVGFSAADNTFVLQHGVQNKPASFRLSGAVEPDGRLRLVGSGFARNTGVLFGASFEATRTDEGYEGAGNLGAQSCKLRMSQQQ